MNEITYKVYINFWKSGNEKNFGVDIGTMTPLLTSTGGGLSTDFTLSPNPLISSAHRVMQPYV